LVRPVGIEPTA